MNGTIRLKPGLAGRLVATEPLDEAPLVRPHDLHRPDEERDADDEDGDEDDERDAHGTSDPVVTGTTTTRVPRIDVTLTRVPAGSGSLVVGQRSPHLAGEGDTSAPVGVVG